MITKSTEGRELVAMLAKSITSAIAPEEMEDFEELAEDYFQWSKRSDRTLGAGLDLFPDLVFVLFFISQVLSALVKGILDLSGAKATARRRKELIHALAVHMEMLSGGAGSPSRLSGEAKPVGDPPIFATPQIEEAIRRGREALAVAAAGTEFAGEKESLLIELTRAHLVNLRAFRPIDLSMRVQMNFKDGKTRLSFELHSPNGILPYFHRSIGETALDGDPADLFKELEVSSDLINFGRSLYDRVFPDALREAYRSFRSVVTTLQITSDEPWIPWELVRPYDDSDPERIIDDGFLCERFQLTRWLAGGRGPAASVRVGKLACIAAGQRSADAHSGHGAEECAVVKALARRHVEVVDASPQTASRSGLLSLMADGGVGLLHVVGDGFFSRKQPEESAMILSASRDDLLRPRDFSGQIQTQIKLDRPLVYLNAPEAGRQGWSLSGLGGWPSRLVSDCGCGAFIAPQWQTDPRWSAVFARVFYEAIERGETFGAGVQEAREEVKKLAGDDTTWLAYAIFADPNGRLAIG